MEVVNNADLVVGMEVASNADLVVGMEVVSNAGLESGVDAHMEGLGRGYYDCWSDETPCNWLTNNKQ